MTRPVRIVGLGTAVPAHRVDQELAAALAAARCCTTPRQEQWLRTIYEKSGVHRRGSALLAETNGRIGEADHATRVWPVLVGATAADLPASPTPGARDGADPAAVQETAALLAQRLPLPTEAADRGPTTAQRMAWYAELAPALGERACREALAEAGLPAPEITHLITVSCTGFFAPGLDVELITRLGLSPDVGRTHVGFMGCHGGFNALQLARALALANPRAAVLVCCVELCTLHFHYGWDPQRVVTDSLFADGAAAAVVRGPPDGPSERRGDPGTGARAGPDDRWGCNGRGTLPPAGQWALLDAGSYVVPDSRDAMTWAIGDHGFEMTLGPQVPRLIEQHLGVWLAGFLRPHGLAAGDIARWAIHPGGPRILTAAARALNLADGALAASRGILADYGNMSSATILFILKRLRDNAGESGGGAIGSGGGHEIRGAGGASRGGGTCVALGFGPGLVVEGLLLDLC
jgi:predicted naringenin-chalcone synthase